MMNLSLAIVLSFAFTRSSSFVSATILVGGGAILAMLGDAARADHLHVLLHQATGAGGIAHFDEGGELLVGVENAARHLWRQRRIARGPGYVLQRDELHHQHAVVRCL